MDTLIQPAIRPRWLGTVNENVNSLGAKMAKLLPLDELVTMLAEVTNRKLSEIGFMAYEIALADIPLESLNAATMRLLNSATFMPSPAEIREAAGVVSGAIVTKDRPTLAWEAVRRAMSQVDGYGSVDFDDKVINATIRQIGGWIELCEATLEQLIWKEKDFLRTYAALATCQLSDELTRPLFGIHEQSNAASYPSEPTTVFAIGCLTTGTTDITKVIAQPETESVKRIESPIAAEVLAKRLTFDAREEKLPLPPQRTKDEMLAALKGMKS